MPAPRIGPKFIAASFAAIAFMAVVLVAPSSEANVICRWILGQKKQAPVLNSQPIAQVSKDPSALPNELLLHALVTLRATGEPRLLADEVIIELEKLTGLERTQLSNPEVVDNLLRKFRARVDDQTFSRVVGQSALGAQSAANAMVKERDSDLRDMQRGFGFRLLPENDPIFRDPHYLADYMKQTGATATGFAINDPAGTRRQFVEEWRKLSPISEPIAFTQTGTDANNLLYSIAARVAQRRAGRDDSIANWDHTEILVMDGAYGGARGRIAGSAKLGRHKSNFIVENPVSAIRNLGSEHPEELARVRQLEDASLRAIRERVELNSPPIGGILVEPILGADGVKFYRTEYLLELRRLCDELRIPIFADEILTGGGRTGKFFAYEHYEGFEPDFITFGKGLQIAGLAYVNRRSDYSFRDFYRTVTDVTNLAPTDALLKGAVIMKRIREGDIMKNVEAVGDYFLKKLQSRYPQTRGIGLLIYAPQVYIDALGAVGRLMPYLTITKEEVDEVLSPRPDARRVQGGLG